MEKDNFSLFMSSLFDVDDNRTMRKGGRSILQAFWTSIPTKFLGTISKLSLSLSQLWTT